LRAWQHLAFTVIEAIANHDTRWSEPSRRSFQEGLTQLAEFLKNDQNPVSVLLHAETAARRIEDYQRETEQLIDRSVAELNDIIGMLVSSTATVQMESQDSEATLSQILEKIQQTRTVADLRVAKADLSRALRKLQQQTAARKQRAANLVTSLDDRMFILDQSCSACTVRFAAALQRASTGESDEATVTFEASEGKPLEPAPAPAEQQLDALTGLPDGEPWKRS
jgi:flagellar basal body rod protein FlgB